MSDEQECSPTKPDMPDLSIIVMTNGTYEVCRRAVRFLGQQTIRDRIELILVGPSRDEIAADPEDLAAIGSHRIIEVGAVTNTGIGIAAGVRAARAPVVTYLEEHDFIPRDHAEKILAAMRRNAGPATGFAIRPANPGLVSWTHVFLQFGEVADPVQGTVARDLGGHHVAYRRAFLLSYGEALHHVMTNEGILFEDLRRAGRPLHVDGNIVVEHVQISRFWAYFRMEYLSQRIYAHGRWSAQNWSPWRRAAYVIGSPAIPILRVSRGVRHVIRTGRGRELLPQIVPVMLACACAGAAGEAVGYVLGSRRKAHAERTAVELDRYAYVSATDRPERGKTAGSPAE